jgi:hypothetical protein
MSTSFLVAARLRECHYVGGNKGEPSVEQIVTYMFALTIDTLDVPSEWISDDHCWNNKFALSIVGIAGCLFKPQCNHAMSLYLTGLENIHAKVTSQRWTVMEKLSVHCIVERLKIISGDGGFDRYMWGHNPVDVIAACSIGFEIMDLFADTWKSFVDLDGPANIIDCMTKVFECIKPSKNKGVDDFIHEAANLIMQKCYKYAPTIDMINLHLYQTIVIEWNMASPIGHRIASRQEESYSSCGVSHKSTWFFFGNCATFEDVWERFPRLFGAHLAPFLVALFNRPLQGKNGYELKLKRPLPPINGLIDKYGDGVFLDELKGLLAAPYKVQLYANKYVLIGTPESVPDARCCSKCNLELPSPMFSRKQWHNARRKRRCLDCISLVEVEEEDPLIEHMMRARNEERTRIINELEKRNLFEVKDDECPICFEVSERHKFGCGHWMCKTCFSTYEADSCHMCRKPLVV